MFRLALFSLIYFLLSRHQSWHFGLLAPETRDVATRVSGLKWVQSTELEIVNGSLCNLCKLALWLVLHIFATQCWWAPRRAKQLSTVAILLYRFLSCWCLHVSKGFSRSISLAVYRLSLHFLADQVFYRSANMADQPVDTIQLLLA